MKTNLWVRAEQHLACPDTRNLLAPTELEQYDHILNEVARTGAELNDALGAIAVYQAAHQAALDARSDYFRGRPYED